MTLDAVRKRLTTNEVSFVYDPEGSVHYWKLRSLPAINYLGIEDVTYPTSWRQLKHTWEYERGAEQHDFSTSRYHLLGNLDHPSAEDLCVVTTSYYENQTQYTIKHLIDRYTASEGTLVVVADERRFQPSGSLRPLYQEQFVQRVGSYDQIYKAFADAYGDAGWELPLQNTKNLFVQDNANLYRFVEGESVATAEELFEVLPEAPYLPLYSVFSEIFAREAEYGTSSLESEETVEALGGWLRRRIEWDKSTASDIAHTLNRRVAMEGDVFEPAAAKRSPKLQDARAAATDLDPEATDIDARYRDWLTEGSR